MELYLAAPIFNDEQRAVVEEMKFVMEVYGNVFSPYHASRDIWKGRAPKDCTPEERAQVLEGNISHLDCDIVVAWVGGNPGGWVDPGVIWELGYATALRRAFYYRGHRPVILAYVHPDDQRQSMNLMIAGTIDGVAFGREELSKALRMLADSGDRDEFKKKFGAEHRLAHEREPIV